MELYESMLRIRLIELAVAKEYPQGEIRCPVHLSVGQELFPSLIALLTNVNDSAISTHRSHAHYLAKGGSLKKFIAELYGKSTGCSKGRGGSMHLIDLDVNFFGATAIVGNSIPVGVGLAYSEKIQRTGNIVMIYIGDGAIEEGVFYESVNFASLYNLPVIFLCENNLYSVYSPIEKRQPKNRQISQMVAGLGIHSVKLDSSDISSSFHKLHDAFEFTREKVLPVFVEIDAFRLLEHCGPSNDDSLKYRDQDYIHNSLEKDPLACLEKELANTIPNFRILQKGFQQLIEVEISESISFAKESPFPVPELEESQIFAESTR